MVRLYKELCKYGVTMTVEPRYIMGDDIRFIFRKDNQAYAFVIGSDEMFKSNMNIEEMLLLQLERFITVIESYRKEPYERRVHENT